MVSVSESSVIKGQITNGVSVSVLSSLMLTQSIALPITIIIMLTYSMQIAATSVAMEKEEKTLETLLTTPVDRFAILMGKVSSTIIVAGVAAVTVLIGYNYMLGSFTSNIAGNAGGSVDLVALGLVPSLGGYTLLGISLFFTLLSALALAVVMSAFSENVRGAQALVGYIYPLIFLPSMALIYLDVNTVVFGIVYVALFTVVIMYIASRLFATEKILTMKLKLGKGKAKPSE